jgi:hypothetical protein
MASDKNEPQSYGSGEEWVTGETGQKVNAPKSSPTAEHQEFYDSRRDAEGSAPHQGGHTSAAQLADHEQASAPAGNAAETDHQPVTKVTSNEGGAKRDSFFRKRDYE